MIIMNQLWKCPRCNNHTQGYGATSRRDNKTYDDELQDQEDNHGRQGPDIHMRL